MASNTVVRGNKRVQEEEQRAHGALQALPDHQHAGPVQDAWHGLIAEILQAHAASTLLAAAAAATVDTAACPQAAIPHSTPVARPTPAVGPRVRIPPPAAASAAPAAGQHAQVARQQQRAPPPRAPPPQPLAVRGGRRKPAGSGRGPGRAVSLDGVDLSELTAMQRHRMRHRLAVARLEGDIAGKAATVAALSAENSRLGLESDMVEGMLAVLEVQVEALLRGVPDRARWAHMLEGGGAAGSCVAAAAAAAPAEDSQQEQHKAHGSGAAGPSASGEAGASGSAATAIPDGDGAGSAPALGGSAPGTAVDAAALVAAAAATAAAAAGCASGSGGTAPMPRLLGWLVAAIDESAARSLTIPGVRSEWRRCVTGLRAALSELGGLAPGGVPLQSGPATAPCLEALEPLLTGGLGLLFNLSLHSPRVKVGVFETDVVSGALPSPGAGDAHWVHVIEAMGLTGRQLQQLAACFQVHVRCSGRLHAEWGQHIEGLDQVGGLGGEARAGALVGARHQRRRIARPQLTPGTPRHTQPHVPCPALPVTSPC